MRIVLVFVVVSLMEGRLPSELGCVAGDAAERVEQLLLPAPSSAQCAASDSVLACSFGPKHPKQPRA